MYMEKYTKWIYLTFYTNKSDQSWKWDHHTTSHIKDWTYKKSVYYNGSKLWNDLNEDIRNITELSEFKKNINAL